MIYRLFQMLFLLKFYIINSFGNNQLLCYSCKGLECEQISKQITCNKETQLCWAGFINQQPYRTCASRYCTPNDISLDNNIHIETCCRSNLCNSISLSQSIQSKSYCINNLSKSQLNTTDRNNICMNFERLLYDKDLSTRIASISHILLFLMPLLLVLFL